MHRSALLFAAFAGCVVQAPVVDPGDDDDPDSLDTDVVDTDVVDTEDTDPLDTDPPDTDVADTDDTAATWEPPVVNGCRATPRRPNDPRIVLAALPYDAAGGPATTWAALRLAPDGRLTDPGVRFDMGRSWEGEVQFTPDGSLAVAVDDGGGLGVAAIDAAGRVRVVHASFTGDFYANRVMIDPTGERLWIVDGNWPNNGGGLYEAAIDCATGQLSGVRRVVSTKLAADLLPLGPDRAVLVGREVGPGADPADDVALLAWGAAPSVLSAVDAFGDNDAIPSKAAILGEHVFVGDISEFSGIPTRIAGVRIAGDALAAEQVIDVPDPVSLVASPWGDVLLVVNGYGNSLLIFDYDPVGPAPLTLRGSPTWVGGRPQLPGSAVAVTRGALKGLTLVAEVEGVRRTWMRGGGVVEDLGRLSLGAGIDGIVGALGVQP